MKEYTLYRVLKVMSLPLISMLIAVMMDALVYTTATQPTGMINWCWAVAVIVSIIMGYFYDDIDYIDTKRPRETNKGFVLGVGITTVILFILFGIGHSVVSNHYM